MVLMALGRVYAVIVFVIDSNYDSNKRFYLLKPVYDIHQQKGLFCYDV